jgi:hypothetical protein
MTNLILHFLFYVHKQRRTVSAPTPNRFSTKRNRLRTPEVLEPIRLHGCVDGGVGNVLVTEPMLKAAGVVASIRQRIAAPMS